MGLPTAISLLLTLLALGEVLADEDFPIVTLPQGTLRGQKVAPAISENLAPYFRFVGIPYAQPPVGYLRFKAPVPADSWNGTYNAFLEGSPCLQPYSPLLIVTGKEDCLYLNVYTPELPESKSGSLKPVMVWIHGGGFTQGSGNSNMQGPQYLLATGIVFVSLNYRLGIMGFLSTEDEAAPGNAGMKDQVLALRWVQQNIAAFGGDPSKVTIFGESAGGASVSYQMLSPMSQGLFRAAIADSGSAANAWAEASKPRQNAFLVGKALGYNGLNSIELVDFLRKVDPVKLVSTSYVTRNPEDQLRTMGRFHEVPNVEPVIEGEEAFLTEHPLTMLKEGKFHNLPFITGVNLAEGLLNADIMLEEKITLQEIDGNFSKVFKPELRYCKEEACGDDMVAKLRAFYIGEESLSDSNMQKFVDMCTDVYFAEGVVHGVKQMSAQNSAPVYFYDFIFDGTLQYVNYSQIHVPGPGHADELAYIFDIGVHVPDNSTEAKVRSRMVTMWTNFVKTGNPTPNVTDEFPAWLPYKSDATNYLKIGEELEAKTDYNKERMDFWDELYSSQG